MTLMPAGERKLSNSATALKALEIRLADAAATVESPAAGLPAYFVTALELSAKAHKDMEGRDTTGSSILVP